MAACETIVRQQCHYECSEFFHGMAGTIEGTCALGGTVAQSNAGRTSSSDAGPSERALDAPANTTATVDWRRRPAKRSKPPYA